MSRSLYPGLALAGAIAIVSRATSAAITVRGSHPISDVTLAILAGILIRAAWPQLRATYAPGAGFAVKRLLRLGIVLLGLGLSLRAVLTTGAGALAIIVTVVLAALVLTRWLGRLAGCRDKLATLIAVGTGICGATAIVTAAPVIEADDDDVCYAVAVITVFGMLAIFLYPLIGSLLGLADRQFGAWAGLAIHDTAQVVAAGFSYSEAAGKVATVVKLTRTSLLAPLVLVLAAMYRSGKERGNVNLRKSFPWFIGGFLALAFVRSLGDSAFAGAASPAIVAAWAGLKHWTGYLARLLIVTAMAGVGLSTDTGAFRAAGYKPLAIGFAASVIVGLASLALIVGLRF